MKCVVYTFTIHLHRYLYIDMRFTITCKYFVLLLSSALGWLLFVLHFLRTNLKLSDQRYTCRAPDQSFGFIRAHLWCESSIAPRACVTTLPPERVQADQNRQVSSVQVPISITAGHVRQSVGRVVSSTPSGWKERAQNLGEMEDAHHSAALIRVEVKSATFPL